MMSDKSLKSVLCRSPFVNEYLLLGASEKYSKYRIFIGGTREIIWYNISKNIMEVELCRYVIKFLFEKEGIWSILKKKIKKIKCNSVTVLQGPPCYTVTLTI